MKKRTFAVQKIPHTKLLLIAVVIAAFATFVVEPGVLYSDSFERADYADMIVHNSWWRGFIPYVTMLPSVYIAFFLWLTNNIAVYTFVQAAMFLWVIEEALCIVCKNYLYAVAVFAIFSPLFVGCSVWWETGVVTVAGLVCLVFLDRALDGERDLLMLWLKIALYVFLCFTITGYRVNATTAIAGLLLWNGIETVCWQKKKRMLAARFVAAVLGVFLALQVPSFLGVENKSNAMTGVLWETACTVSRVGPGHGYDEYLYPIIGEGNTSRLFGVEDPEGSMYQFSDIFDYWSIVKQDDGEILDSYIQIIKEKPVEYLGVKAKIIWNTLTDAKFNEGSYSKDYNNRLQEFSSSDTMRRDRAINLVNQYMEVISFLQIPVLLFGMALALILACKLLRREVLAMMQLWFVAFCYEGGYFVTTQSYEFRYFFPAWFLLVLVILAAAGSLVRGLRTGGRP